MACESRNYLADVDPHCSLHPSTVSSFFFNFSVQLQGFSQGVFIQRPTHGWATCVIDTSLQTLFK